MKRIFLSHSSVNKDFVRAVASLLGDVAIIDENDFGAGARTMNEIVEKLNDASIFVAFLSNKALESAWVQKELELAISYASSHDIEILVFSIDKSVVYTDKRIPENLRKQYNIKYLRTAEIGVSRILDAYRMLALKESPVLRQTENLFIGRANQIQQFESDFSDLEGNIPTFIIAYNYYAGIGRRHFIKHILNKINILKATQSPITVYMKKGESIENLIIKLNSVVFNDKANKADLSVLSIEQKIRLLMDLIKDYKRNNRLLFIIDEGAIVLPNHKITDWFNEVSQQPELHNKITFCIISNWEPNYRYLSQKNKGVAYHIDELDGTDTKNLFLQLLNIYGQTQLTASNKREFVSHLTGIPAQIHFAVQQIRVVGIQNALLRIEDISTHSDSYTSALIEAIKGNEIAYQLCLILADGGLSLDIVYEIFGETPEIKDALTYLYDYSALDYIDGSITIAKLNTTVADFIKRRKIQPDEKYKKKLKEAISKYLEMTLDELALDDYTKFMLALEEYLNKGNEIPKKYYIAPLLINNIIRYYNAGNYQAVEDYCIKLLRQTNYDAQVKWELHYRLALVYARIGNEKFWSALSNSPLDYIDKEFLIGFYYRNKKSHEEIRQALEHFHNVLNTSSSHRRARREIVNTYLLLDDYESALEYAKENYEQNPSDILHLQSYFISLIRHNKFDVVTDEATVVDLMSKAKTLIDPRAQDIYKCMAGEYAYCVKHDLKAAVKILEEAIKINENKRFPLKALLSIYRKEGLFEEANQIKKQLSRL